MKRVIDKVLYRIYNPRRFMREKTEARGGVAVAKVTTTIGVGRKV